MKIIHEKVVKMFKIVAVVPVVLSAGHGNHDNNGMHENHHGSAIPPTMMPHMTTGHMGHFTSSMPFTVEDMDMDDHYDMGSGMGDDDDDHEMDFGDHSYEMHMKAWMKAMRHWHKMAKEYKKSMKMKPKS